MDDADAIEQLRAALERLRKQKTVTARDLLPLLAMLIETIEAR